ncbi:hypothetical protein KR093_005625 [Drosophila rubida]|uniref:Fibrinogen C-terminal domain-containing protein n=1 Tax=Drosophila rubida TaxID=30044 RepID=A0AAD4K4R3_9MUSC|nr:hypothetical protein KR093_005625 [Drosophila rubida]
MLLKLIHLLLTLSLCLVCSDCNSNSEFNETSAILSIKSELAELRANQTLYHEELRLIRMELGQMKPVAYNAAETYGRNCAEVTATFKHNGIHEILIPTYSNLPFKVDCDTKTQGGGWTILLRRLNGSVDFHRNWTEYKNGFGDIDGEFFLGLDKVHALTADKPQEVIFILEDFQNDVRYEMYDEFAIGDELAAYALHTLGKPSGTAGDSFSYHRGHKFTTLDRHNDVNGKNCAELYTGAWWYNKCHGR